MLLFPPMRDSWRWLHNFPCTIFSFAMTKPCEDNAHPPRKGLLP